MSSCVFFPEMLAALRVPIPGAERSADPESRRDAEQNPPSPARLLREKEGAIASSDEPERKRFEKIPQDRYVNFLASFPALGQRPALNICGARAEIS